MLSLAQQDVEDRQAGARRVLDAAADLFVSQGYASTTLRQIAGAAGIKAGSIYHHFDSKEAIFIAVLHDGMVVMQDAFEGAESASSNAPLGEQVLAHVHAHLSAVFEHGPYTTAHVTSFFNAPDAVRDEVVPVRDDYEQRWNGLFKRLFPTLKAKDLRLHRLILFGAMNSSAEWFDPGGNVSVAHLAATISRQFLHGINGHEDTP